MTRPGELFYRRLAALGILCDLGRVLKQVPISQGLSAAFVSAGWPGTGPGKRRKIRLRPPRPPQGLVGKSRLTWNASYIISRCFCSLHTSPILRGARPDVAGPRWFVPSFTARPRDARARPPAPPRSAGACTPGGHAGARGRTEGPAASTLLLLLIQLVEYFLVPRVELSILRLRLRALSASAAALSLGALDCVSLVSRSCWYRSVVLVVTGSPVSEASARSRSLTLSGISTRPWFAAVTPSSVSVTSQQPTSRSSC